MAEGKQSGKRYQVTRNVAGLQYGETISQQQAEQHGIDAQDLRDVTTDRSVKSGETTKR